ncbi:MAG: molybdopterin-dependent oxidoreductase [Thermoanaerobaculia bacterium]|nr:molybdopterin-dependent oxidoreductase [Thermoanaerobaculia bacterium]
MPNESPLPPGQYEAKTFYRFGLTPFATRFPHDPTSRSLQISGDVERQVTLVDVLEDLPAVEQLSDFHCVTTWSYRALRWEGVRFADLFQRVIQPQARPAAGAQWVILQAQDGYRTCLPLEDLLAPDVLLATRLDGAAITIEHGAPLRLVVPSHYGYKNVKHLRRLDFCENRQVYRPLGFRFMDHPRARVALEERAVGAPGWFFRYLYRPLVRSTAARFRRTLAEYLTSADRG